MRPFLYLAATILFALPALGDGDKINNGGGLWACQKDNVFLSGVLVDLFEAKEEFHYPLMKQPPQMDAEQIALLVLQRLESDFPALLLELRPHWSEVLAKKVLTNAKIIEIPDSKPRIEPLPADCPSGQWSYLQIANFKGNGQLLIRKDVWESPKLPMLDKAALLWHEAVYRWLRVKDGDSTSSRARQIVGLLFSILSKAQVERELQDILRGPLPKDGGLICVVENLFTRMIYAGYGENDLIARANAKQSCESGENPNGCEHEAGAVCENIGNGTAKWTCVGRNDLEQRTYKASGRSELEARLNTQLSCLTTVDPQRRVHCPMRQSLKCVKSN